MKVDIYELIERIRPRPALYLGSASISQLQSFLNGYQIAAEELNATLEGDPPFGYFHDWIAMKLGKYASTAGWCNMLLESANGDEEKALELFFLHLDQFKQRKATVILQGAPVEKSEWKYSTNLTTGERIQLERPVLVQIVKYTDDKGVFIRYLGADGDEVSWEEYCQDLEVAFSNIERLVARGAWQDLSKNGD
jgi:hypothetical protein